MTKSSDYLYDGTFEEYAEQSNGLLLTKIFNPMQKKVNEMLEEMKSDPEDRDQFLRTNMELLLASLSILNEEYNAAVINDDIENDSDEIPSDDKILTQKIADAMQTLTQLGALMLCFAQAGFKVSAGESDAAETSKVIMEQFGLSVGPRGLIRLANTKPIKLKELTELQAKHMAGMARLLTNNKTESDD